MNDLRRIIGAIFVMLLLAAMAGCSGSDSNNAEKSGSLTGSGK